AAYPAATIQWSPDRYCPIPTAATPPASIDAPFPHSLKIEPASYGAIWMPTPVYRLTLATAAAQSPDAIQVEELYCILQPRPGYEVCPPGTNAEPTTSSGGGSVLAWVMESKQNTRVEPICNVYRPTPIRSNLLPCPRPLPWGTGFSFPAKPL